MRQMKVSSFFQHKEIFLRFKRWLILPVFCFFIVTQPENIYAKYLPDLNNLIGDNDALLIADQKGRIIFSRNAEKQLVPASILKILTSIVALHYLGSKYRFVTEFYLDKDSNLKVKGYGDPLLTSEILNEISKSLYSKPSIRSIKINNIILDNSYYKSPLTIPGVLQGSTEPYDAPNGALCVNFNTVFFKKANGSYVTAEAQTPLLPFAVKRIKKRSAADRARITFLSNNDENVLYAGHLLQYFLNKNGIISRGNVIVGKVRKNNDRLVYRYISSFSLGQIISRLLRYSNNFMANQIFIASGVKAFTPPGTLDKGVLAASDYAKTVLDLKDFSIVEGSGISRKNRISAAGFSRILQEFEPYHNLMRQNGREFYKTGTLKGIKTRAGYIENRKGELFRFVVLINTSGKSTNKIMSSIISLLDSY